VGRRAALIVTLAAALVVAAPASASVRSTLTTTSKTPRVGEQWRWTVTARESGKPVAARVRLQILFGRTVVGCWKGGKMTQCTGAASGDPIAFNGRRTGVITWTADSVGVPLTFQAVVTANKQTRRLSTPVQVRAAGQG
jgi:hypothetical protein